MRTAFALLAALALSACAAEYAHGYRDVSGQQRSMADLARAEAECDYEMDKLRALAGPLVAGPNLRESCMSSKGWALVERRRIS